MSEAAKKEFDNEEFNEIVTEYRDRFPEETKNLTNHFIYDTVLATEDDMEDDEWKALFKGLTA